jgi:hypothetical protein
MLFSALAGGILTFYSLRSVGQPTAGRRALLASAGYVAVLLVLLNLLPMSRGGAGLSVALGYAGGYVLNEYFLKKSLPDEANYPRKSWVKPLLIWIIVLAVGVGGAVAVLTKLGEGA